MGLIHPGVPRQLISEIRTTFGIQTFVETGTFLGNSAAWAAEHFTNVYTIELSQQLWQQALQKYIHFNNIKFIQGDSRLKLEELLPLIDKPTIFWLDSHWSGESTSGEEDECPLLDELAAINTSSLEHFIFIDDARLFLSPPPKPHNPDHWPDINLVLCALNLGITPRFVIIFEDVIIAVPFSARAFIISYTQEMATRSLKQKNSSVKPFFLQLKGGLSRGVRKIRELSKFITDVRKN